MRIPVAAAMAVTAGVAAIAVTMGAAAHAEVLSSAPGGFVVSHEVVVEAGRAAVYTAAVADVGRWWSSDHTVSGDAARLSIDPRPMGCFCEMLEDGNGVVHLTVSFVNEDVIVRLTGGLGPLGLMGVAGNMTWEFFDADGGGTRVKWTYAVGGYRDGGLDAVAGPVDRVISGALERLKAHIETGDPAGIAAPATP
ncbi:MAG: SRPBCC family protein [Pseudomonadota bacterium]